jgi:type IV pilus assembly protein PilN
MGHAELSKTENTHDSSRMPYSFGLTVALNRPKDDAKAKAAAGQSGDAPAAAATARTGKPSVSVAPVKPAPSAPPARDAAAKGGAR